MIRSILLAIALPCISGVALAADCKAANIYVRDMNNVVDADDEAETRVEFVEGGAQILVHADGVTKRYRTLGGGTGIVSRAAINTSDEEDSFPYHFIDLSRIAKEGAPQHALLIGQELYWAACD